MQRSGRCIGRTYEGMEVWRKLKTQPLSGQVEQGALRPLESTTRPSFEVRGSSASIILFQDLFLRVCAASLSHRCRADFAANRKGWYLRRIQRPNDSHECGVPIRRIDARLHLSSLFLRGMLEEDE